MDLMLSVFIGVLTFVAGQAFLRFVLEPMQDLKKALWEISHSFLLYQKELTNAHPSEKIAEQMIALSAKVLSLSNSVPLYWCFRLAFSLPRKGNISEACHLLNQIHYSMLPAARASEESTAYHAQKPDHATDNIKAMDRIGSLLRIQTSYTEN